MSVLQLAGIGLSVVVPVTVFVVRRKKEWNQVVGPISEEMKTITEFCRKILAHIEDIESTDAETLDDAEMYISLNSLKYDMYAENKSDLGVLTEYERKHITNYYDLVEDIHYRANPETHGTPRRDHMRTLSEQIIREHDEIYDYLTAGVYNRWKAQIIETPRGKRRI